MPRARRRSTVAVCQSHALVGPLHAGIAHLLDLELRLLAVDLAACAGLGALDGLGGSARVGHLHVRHVVSLEVC